jgi:hypothetical protein
LSRATVEDELANVRQLCKHLLLFFAKHRLSEVTIAEVDRYRQEKVPETRGSCRRRRSTAR